MYQKLFSKIVDAAPNLATLTDQSWFDVLKYSQPISAPELQITQHCPNGKCFSHTTGAFCKGQNIDVGATSVTDSDGAQSLTVPLSNFACNCDETNGDDSCDISPRSKKLFETDTQSGAVDFGPDALCVAEAMCQDLCNNLGDECIGYDQYVFGEICWLNRKSGDHDFCLPDNIMENPQFHLKMKEASPECYTTLQGARCDGNNLNEDQLKFLRVLRIFIICVFPKLRFLSFENVILIGYDRAKGGNFSRGQSVFQSVRARWRFLWDTSLREFKQLVAR